MNEPLFKPKEVNKSPMQAPDTASKRAQTTQDLMQSRGLSGVPGELYPTPIGAEQSPKSDVAELDEFGQRAATDEEQAVYSQFVYRARDFMAREAGSIIQQMSNPEVPVYQQVGRLALQIAEMTKGLAESAGVEIDQDTMLSGGEEIVESLMELGNAANIFPFSGGDDKYMEQMAMALSFGAELKAKELIDQGDPEVKASYEDKLATEIAREVDRGQGPPPEFFQGIEEAKREIPRRQIYGVK